MTIRPTRHQRLALLLLAGAASLAAALPAAADARTFRGPTYSSPISLSANGRFLWVVNPGGDNVVVIRTSDNRVIRRIAVGDEPQSVALDPNDRYAYVANAAGSSVSLIRITNPSTNPRRFRAGRVRTFVTGAEPWNIVVSPNGRRVFVANSGQDTITVIDGTRRRVGRRVRGPSVLGHVNLRRSRCNEPDLTRHFQPRGLAVTASSRRLYVTGFLAFTRAGGRQASDTGKAGVVCRLNINTRSRRLRNYRVAQRIPILPRVTGFPPGGPDTFAFPNQLQSIVLRGNQGYLPNIAASPDGPLRFNTSTQAFVNVIDGVRGNRQTDNSANKFRNLHLGARDPEPGKKRLFFANVWAIAFSERGPGARAYVVSAGSDLLVKLNVRGNGALDFTVDADTTRYIDLRDQSDPDSAGRNAGINPQGIAINRSGTRAYVNNFVSRNVSVVDLTRDEVIDSIPTAALAPPGSQAELVEVGAEMFFSSRGEFNRPPGTTVPTSERLSSEGWQSCASCHFKGLTDGVIWEFGSGPRKSVPLNASFNPRNRNEQRILNYSAIFDEIEDFEGNIRNTSGPGPISMTEPPVACNAPGAPPNVSPTRLFRATHGLLISDNGDINQPPCVIPSLRPIANANRNQLTVTLPGAGRSPVPAMTALREWARLAVRTPRGPLSRRGVGGRLSPTQLSQGRQLFVQAGCANCHLGGKWTLSTKDFTSPPVMAEVATENANPNPPAGEPVPVPFLHRFLRDIGSFNLGVPGGGNPIGGNVGADETTNATGTVLAALGRDYNGDGRGNGFNVPSLLGIEALPPYYHNGACETLPCVVGNRRHRTANGTLPDRLTTARQRAAVVTFLRSIDARTRPAP
jgi:DNA-binding beta-propeller fold protein YncE